MNTLIVTWHPDPESFTASLCEVAATTLRTVGDVVRIRDLAAEEFDPVMTAAERRAHRTANISPELSDHADDLRWCDQLVFVYPTWWGGQPATIKGWIDRVFVRGVAWDLPPGANRIRGRLTNVRRLTVITTHGSPKRTNALEGEGGKRTVTRTLRALCHPFARTRWIAMYGVDSADRTAREQFVATVRRRLS